VIETAAVTELAYVDEIAAICTTEIRDAAEAIDRSGPLMPVIQLLATHGVFGAFLSEADGGRGISMNAWGTINEAIAAESASLQCLCTVHGMVSLVAARWGSPVVKSRFLPALARGEMLAAFALTEPDAGSDIEAIATTAAIDGDDFVVSGRKSWISYARTAGVFLVFARAEQGPVALLVPSDTDGLTVEEIAPGLSLRGSGQGIVSFDGCRVPRSHAIGGIGAGLKHVAGTALTFGRFGVAWAAIGIAGRALRAAASHATERIQGGVPIARHQLVASMLTEAIVAYEGARLLCLRSSAAHDARDPHLVRDTLIAKYAASTAAVRVTDLAVQILGARGLDDGSIVQRCFRDARALTIIEGTSQVLEVLIAGSAIRDYAG